MSSSSSGAMGRNRAIVLMHIGCCPEASVIRAQRYCRYRRYRVSSAADGQTNYAWNQIWFVEEVHEKNAIFITELWHLKSLAVCTNAAQGRWDLWVIGSYQMGQMKSFDIWTENIWHDLWFLSMQGIVHQKMFPSVTLFQTWMTLNLFLCNKKWRKRQISTIKISRIVHALYSKSSEVVFP